MGMCSFWEYTVFGNIQFQELQVLGITYAIAFHSGLIVLYYFIGMRDGLTGEENEQQQDEW